MPRVFTLLAAVGVLTSAIAGRADDPRPTPSEYAMTVMDRADKAKSVRMTANYKLDGKQHEYDVYYIHREFGHRIEGRRDPADAVPLTLQVFNLPERKLFVLRADAKTARVEEIAMPGPETVVPSRLRFPADITTALGGRATRVLRGTGKDVRTGAWTMWVDARTDLPVKARTRFALPGKYSVLSKMYPVIGVGDRIVEVEYEFADWDEDFDPKLFAAEVPAGYKVIEPGKN